MAIAAHHPFRSPKAKQAYLKVYDRLAEQWPTPSETRMVDTKFGQTFIRMQGPVDGSPLALLPGDTETSLSWLPVIEPFSRSLRTFAIDNVYDNGRSIYTKAPSRPADFVDWLDDLLGELCPGRLSLAGYSYGAWQAVLYALAHPDRVKKLVLLAPSATVLSPSPILLARAVLYYFFPCRFVTRNYFYWYGPDAEKEDLTRLKLDEMVEEDLLARRCFKRRTFVPPTVLTDSDWRDLRVRTLFLVGENDKTYAVQRAVRRLHRVAPDIETKIASNTDHYILQVNPDWVVRNMLHFLRESHTSSENQTQTTP